MPEGKDVFEKSISTVKPQEVANDWESLVPHLDSYITPEKFLGGEEGTRVYDLNNEYVLRLTCGKRSIGLQKFEPVDDVFEGRNFGQAVAKSECGYITINKKVQGSVLYKLNDGLANKPSLYMESLREYAKMPDETLEQFVKDVAFIQEKGYWIDHVNPENFLYDRKAGKIVKIGIVDVGEQFDWDLEPFAHDWILDPLVNGYEIPRIYENLIPAQREEMFGLITQLENRVLPLCKKYGIPEARWNTKNYVDISLSSILQTRGKLNYNNDDLISQVIKLKFPEQLCA